VLSLSLQSDGKLIVGATFVTIVGKPRPGIARLYPDGTLDLDYFPQEIWSSINAQALQQDGKSVVQRWRAA